MKVVVLGTRGIPDIQGGVETHCQELYPRLVRLGCEVHLITRKPYIKNLYIKEYNGVNLHHIFAPKKKSLEAIIHTFLGILYAKKINPDILHIHAIGPSLLVPLAKLLGLKLVVTNHGPDYNRQKWGKLAKFMLRLGERLGTKYADKVIVISNVIKKILEEKYKRKDTELIFNGVTLPQKAKTTDFIKSLNLEPKKYIIAVGRFVEEKGFHDLINAYSKLNTDIKLVLVGDADHETNYSKNLKKLADENEVIRTGIIKGSKLNEIFTHALLFVMPSYHEGLPIALLEAMSYDLDVLVSNIPPNLELNLGKENYFKVGDIENLKLKLEYKLNNPILNKDWSQFLEKYNWDIIAEQTLKVYKKILKGEKR